MPHGGRRAARYMPDDGGRHGPELVQAEPLLSEEVQETITAR
jgi:hypothetical protein